VIVDVWTPARKAIERSVTAWRAAVSSSVDTQYGWISK
jgi:hypothetical protein